MLSSLDWFGTLTKPEAHASEKKTNEKKPTKRQMKRYTTGAERTQNCQDKLIYFVA